MTREWTFHSAVVSEPGGRIAGQDTFGFRLVRNPTEGAIILLHWSLITITGVIAAVPWLQWRFNLRNLLIATTLVSVILGTIVYAIR